MEKRTPPPLKSKTKKSRMVLAIVGVTLAVGIFFYISNKSVRATRQAGYTGRLVAFLCYYAEQHSGSLPESWQALEDMGFCKKKNGSPYSLIFSTDAANYGGFEIDDTRDYSIMFGVNGKDLRIESGKVLDCDGNIIRLFDIPPERRFWDSADEYCQQWNITLAELLINLSNSQKGKANDKDEK